MNGSQSPTLRLIPELRNYHVALAPRITPSDTGYFEQKYDLSTAELAGFERMGTREALRRVLDGRYSQLIIWEPLWVRMLPKHILLVTAWRMRTLRRRPVVSYAMENNDLGSLMVGRRRVSRAAVWAFSVLLGCYMRFAYTKLAFASEGAATTYRAIPLVRRVESRVILNLPARKEAQDVDIDPGRVVMVARMETRKGIDVLMEAWPQVENARADASIVLVGGGPEGEKVADWASLRPASRRYLGSTPHDTALAEVARAAVLVLPSVRDGRWREQIGLPLHEGLTNGLTIVTTDETGLARTLAEAGHYVIPVGAIRERLAQAVLAALDKPLAPADVRAVLPEEDGRVEADRWLVGGAP